MGHPRWGKLGPRGSGLWYPLVENRDEWGSRSLEERRGMKSLNALPRFCSGCGGEALGGRRLMFFSWGSSGLAGHGEAGNLAAGAGQTFRMMLLQECDQLFSNVTAQIKGERSSRCTHQGAKFQRVFRCIGYLQAPNFSVPHAGGLQDAVKFFAHHV